MICPNCNKDNNPEVSFCVNCGTRLVPVQTSKPSTPPTNPYEYKDPSAVKANEYIPNPMPTSQQFAQDEFPNQKEVQSNNNDNNTTTVQPNVDPTNQKDNALAKKLAIISLSLFIGNFVIRIVAILLLLLITYLSIEYSYSFGTSFVSFIVAGIASLCYIAAIVLIIIAKVKISRKKLKNTFVNVVFWIEMASLIIASLIVLGNLLLSVFLWIALIISAF